jgi:predicted Zn finger-like uncharacterized protein
MLIVCPSCATAYEIDAASLPPDGRQVRCVRCRTVWHAGRPLAEELLAAAAAIAPDWGREAAATGSKDEADWDHAPADAPSAGEPAASDDPWAQLQQEIASPPTAFDGVAPIEGIDQAIAVRSPSIAPVDLDEGRPPIDIDSDRSAPPQPLEDIETYAVRRARENAKRNLLRWPLSRLQTAILALLVVDAVVIGWRGKIVRILPQTASFYAELGLPVNLRNLGFDDVTTATEMHEGVPILVVQGNVVNDTRKTAEVPRLKFVVRNAARQEIYSWTSVPNKNALPPGEALAFHTRLASPPTEAHDVLVRFLNRRDILAGAR